MRKFITQFVLLDIETHDQIIYFQDDIIAENIFYAEAICDAIGNYNSGEGGKFTLQKFHLN